MATTTKAKPEWFINVNKLPDGITVLHAPFSCMLFIITYDKNYAAIKNAQMRICVVEGDLFKEQKASIAAKHGHFQAYLQDDGTWIQALKEIRCFRLSRNIFGFVSPAAVFLYCLPLGKSSHLQRNHELEHSSENLWEINHKVLAREVLCIQQDLVTEQGHFSDI